MNTILITGISGQDGLYLAEFLLKKNCIIIGTTRDSHKSIKNIPDYILKKITLIEWDLVSSNDLDCIIKKYQPDEIYNFAAYSSGESMYDNPKEMMSINGGAVVTILDSILNNNINIKFCQASSSEMFGNVNDAPQSELTNFNPQNPYGKAKLFAHEKIGYYRSKYKIFACSAILYNHESSRRGLNFVTKKITNHVVKIKLKLLERLELGDIQARRDWLHAKDAVLAMYLMMQAKVPSDYVVASGESHSVEEFCDVAFNCLDLNYKDYVVQSKKFFRDNDRSGLIGDCTKIKTLGWEPEYSFKEIVSEMVASDFEEYNH